jgi:hypothetical protein
MSRRTRRAALKQGVQLTPPNPAPAEPVPVPEAPDPRVEPGEEPVMQPIPRSSGGTPDAAAKPEPFGGKGDHDGNGKTGGAAAPLPSRVPVLGDEQQADVDAAAERQAPPARERTLHELNLEARAIDRWHAQKREEAQAALRQTVDPMLEGVLRPRQVMRRVQKNLRAPVKE